jgi:pimeloyl-ACP methyl ester carboxylesterase
LSQPEGVPIATATELQVAENFANVDGLRLRYLEMGEGPVVLKLHGASLGSSGDVFRRNMPAFAKAGMRAIAIDLPGYGGSDKTEDHSAALRKRCMIGLLDALNIQKAALMAHSQSGGPAVQLAMEYPQRITHVVVLGTGSLLPPDEAAPAAGGAAAQQRLERRMAAAEPTLADTRKLLEANLFHHELITPEELELRHQMSLGDNFKAFVARSELPDAPKAERAPLWQKLIDLPVPLLMIYGKQDRAHAFERATRLKELYPKLNLIIVDDCKHLVPWDAADLIAKTAVPFVKS